MRDAFCILCVIETFEAAMKQILFFDTRKHN